MIFVAYGMRIMRIIATGIQLFAFACLPRTPFGVATAAGCCVIATGINTPVKD